MSKCFELLENIEKLEENSFDFHCCCCDKENSGNQEIDSTFLYPNGGTEDNPANVTKNTRYILDTPYPGYLVKCIAQVYFNEQWGQPGWVVNVNVTPPSAGVFAGQQIYADKTSQIIVQTGNRYVLNNNSANTGDRFGITPGVGQTSLPCRIYVEKGGRLP